MLPPEGEPLTAEHVKQAIHDIREFLRDSQVSQAGLAKAIRVSDSTLVELFNPLSRKEMKHDRRDRLIRKALNWIEREIAARQRQQLRPDNYYGFTKPATRLYAVAKRLSQRPDIAVVFAPAGTGKTTILRAIAAELNMVLVEVRGRTRRIRALMKALWQASRPRRRSRIDWDQLVDTFAQPDDVRARTVIAIDQAHLLDDNCWQLVMDLVDECRVSVLLVGTKDIYATVLDDEDPFYGQLSSRVGMRVDLTPELTRPGGSRKPFTVKDVRAMFQTGKIRLHSDAAKLLTHIANSSNGHLRRVDRLVEWAASIARKRDRGDDVTITAEDVHEASRIVESEGRTTKMLLAADDSAEAPAAAEAATA